MNSTEPAIAKRISPMLTVADMDETVSFYETVLGFKTTMSSAAYVIMERNEQTIHFHKADSKEVLECVRGHAEIYIEVSGIQDLWEHVKTFKNQYKIRDLFDQPYGMTEFHIGDPNECLVFVGEHTKPN